MSDTAINPPASEKQTCAYCYQPIDSDDLEMRQIFSPNWKDRGYKSPPRPYHKSKFCWSKDQMAHEG